VNGDVDEFGRALLTLTVRASAQSETHPITVWIDTAFDGELVMSVETIERLGLTCSAAVQATLADGTTVVLDTFACEIEWFGEWRHIEVIANEGRFPLLGIAMMCNRKLIVDYSSKQLELM